MEGRRPLPPAAATLGLEIVDADVEKGTIEVAFTATEDFKTPRGDLRPAYPGRLVVRGRAVHRDGDVAFFEATLADSDDTVVATGTVTVRVIDLPA